MDLLRETEFSNQAVFLRLFEKQKTKKRVTEKECD